MEEAEGLTEHSEEHIHHATHSGPGWITWVALTTAILGGLAAIASNLSGHNETEAMLHQIECSDTWAHYQAKSIKLAISETRGEIASLKHTTAEGGEGKAREGKESPEQKAARYEAEQEKLKEEATELQKESKTELHRHEMFARTVTLFQVAIVVGAVSVLTRRRRYWLVSLGFGAVGVVLLGVGLTGYFAH